MKNLIQSNFAAGIQNRDLVLSFGQLENSQKEKNGPEVNKDKVVEDRKGYRLFLDLPSVRVNKNNSNKHALIISKIHKAFYNDESIMGCNYRTVVSINSID